MKRRIGQSVQPAGRRTAFTLIELLMVVLIIGMLGSLLMPAISAVRDRAKVTSCTSNIRYLSMGLLSYIGEYDSMLPTVHYAEPHMTTNLLSPLPTAYYGLGKLIERQYIDSPSALYCPGIVRFQQAATDGGLARQACIQGTKDIIRGWSINTGSRGTIQNDYALGYANLKLDQTSGYFGPGSIGYARTVPELKWNLGRMRYWLACDWSRNYIKYIKYSHTRRAMMPLGRTDGSVTVLPRWTRVMLPSNYFPPYSGVLSSGWDTDKNTSYVNNIFWRYIGVGYADR
jgi:prepilin-type N-terminal cleavage/methylation domain-containing protein